MFKTVYVKQVSLSTLSESGYEPSDGGSYQDEAYGHFGELSIISTLTNRQRKVVNLLAQGFSRKEIARELGISLQAIHQIVPRIRKRITSHAQKR
jgi:DNA-binding NarL/FixJ family response regulator